MNTDRIEKQIVLRATKARVWKAVTDSAEFGTWFRAKLEGPFKVGQWTKGKITYPGYENLTLQLLVERMDAEELFSFRWFPNEIDPKKPPAPEAPTTLVEFRLEAANGGTRLTVSESGFDALPPERRAIAFRSNDEGWTIQLQNIERHVAA